MTSEGNSRNLKWRLRTLGQAVRLSERMRVAHRLSLFLVRPRNSLVSLSSWSGSRAHSPPLQKGFRNGACFLLYRLGKSSNDQLRKTKARQESLTMCKSFKPRRFAVFQVCLQNNQRQKQQKQKCVKSRKALLIVKAARLEDLIICKSFRPRLCFLQPVRQ